MSSYDKSKVIIVYCKTDDSSAAKNILAQHDFIVYNMLGGINAWKGKFDTSTSAPTDAEIPSPSILPEHTPAPSPATSLALTPTVSPTASPVHTSTPTSEEEKHIPGFEVTVALAAISLIAWRRVLRKQ